MNDQEIQETKIFMKIYEQTLDIEQAFERLEQLLLTHYSIAHNFDLNNPDTYLKLITPVSKSLNNVKNLCILTRYSLKEYRELKSEQQPKGKETVIVKDDIIKEEKKSSPKSWTEIQLEMLEKRLDRLEIITSILLGLLLGNILLWLLGI